MGSLSFMGSYNYIYVSISYVISIHKTLKGWCKMTKRSTWCEFNKETRKEIKKRDGNKCVVCGNKGALQIMHVFMSRAKGGKGCKENGALGCVKCHQIIDNPIGNEQNLLSQEYLSYVKNYLIDKEGIEYGKEFLDSLKYQKKVESFKVIEKPIPKIQRCKDCKMLVKLKNGSSSIPNYYCKYKKMGLNKTTKACKKFRDKNK